MKTTKKVRFLFLLFLMVSGTANLKAQVTIGSEQKPRDGAVLDLSQVNDQNLGFLLPRVSLRNVTEWQLQGDSTNGVGMLVYNINPQTIGGNGIGVYIRTETKVWEALKSNLSNPAGGEACLDVPEKPGEISFWGTWGTQVNLGGTFIASVPDVTGPNRPLFYDWTLPSGLTNSSSIGYARSRTITITGDSAGTYNAGDITVKATNACGTNEDKQSNTSAVTVRVCSDVPETPGPIKLSEDTVIFNGRFHASVPEVTEGTQIPTSYTWTLPEGLTEIGSSTKGDTIQITGATAGTYGAGTIKVTAINDCGPSLLPSSASAVTVLNCTVAPGTPGTITLDPGDRPVNNGEKFWAEVSEVSGATSYIWDIPDGLTPIGGLTTSLPTIEIMGATQNTYTIKVAAKNGCGTSEYSGGTSVEVLGCSEAPENAGPIKLSKDTINLNDTVTASIDEVSRATFYLWDIPEGLTPTGVQIPTTEPSITLTGTKADTTYAEGTITVIAKNDCGGDYESKSTSAVTVRVCSDVPVKPDTIILTKDTINLNGTFEAFVHKVNTGTQIPTSYIWTWPEELTVTGSSTGDTIRITGATAGTWDIGVTANNDCGPSEERIRTSAVTVRDCSAAPTVTSVGTTNLEVKQNDSQSISVSADGHGDSSLDYQWQISTTGTGDWSNVSSDGTSTSYAVPTGTIGKFYYRCQVSNDCGTSTSGTYTITVKPLCTGIIVPGGASVGGYRFMYSVEQITGFSLQQLEDSFPTTLRRVYDLCVHEVEHTGKWLTADNTCRAMTDDQVDGTLNGSEWRLPSVVEFGLSGLQFGALNLWTDAQVIDSWMAWYWSHADGLKTLDQNYTRSYRCVRTLK